MVGGGELMPYSPDSVQGLRHQCQGVLLVWGWDRAGTHIVAQGMEDGAVAVAGGMAGAGCARRELGAAERHCSSYRGRCADGNCLRCEDGYTLVNTGRACTGSCTKEVTFDGLISTDAAPSKTPPPLGVGHDSPCLPVGMASSDTTEKRIQRALQHGFDAEGTKFPPGAQHAFEAFQKNVAARVLGAARLLLAIGDWCGTRGREHGRSDVTDKHHQHHQHHQQQQ
jgi:hypothetical protein